MADQQTKRDMSRYRQIRLTVTQQWSGRLDYSIYAKGLQQAWDEHLCLVRASVDTDEDLATTEDVLRAIMVVLADQVPSPRA